MMAQCDISTVSPLKCKCMSIICDMLKARPENCLLWGMLSVLPLSLKASLFQILCTRGLIDGNNIDIFVDTDITEIYLGNCVISEALLRKISLFKNTSKLDLSCTTNVPSDVFCSMFSVCTNLRVVLLQNCDTITDIAIQTLAKSCPFLRVLNIAGCRQVTDLSLIAIAENCHILESLDFTATHVTDVGVRALAKSNCTSHLKELCFRRCLESVSEEITMAIIKACPNLSIIVCDYSGTDPGVNMEAFGLMDLVSQVNRRQKMSQLFWTFPM